jgi:hypothetical protein
MNDFLLLANILFLWFLSICQQVVIVRLLQRVGNLEKPAALRDSDKENAK